jgi:hypothetical protein
LNITQGLSTLRTHNEIEKTTIVDTVSKEYPDYSTAQAYQMEIEEAWREYLQNKNPQS